MSIPKRQMQFDYKYIIVNVIEQQKSSQFIIINPSITFLSKGNNLPMSVYLNKKKFLTPKKKILQLVIMSRYSIQRKMKKTFLLIIFRHPRSVVTNQVLL